MDPLTEPQVVLTHESDLDGLVSGLLLQRLARHLFGKEVPLEAYHYQGWKARQLSERTAWVSDFTFEARLDRKGWLVVDHHATETRPSAARLIHDPSKSASRLCHDLVREHGLGSPELDRIVRNLHSLIGGRIEALLDHPLLEVMRVRRRVEDPIGFAWAREHVEALSPEVGLVRPVVGNTNVIVHQLLERGATTHPVLATLFKKGNGAFIVSFRSRNGEALKVAARFDGGGHPNASGTTLPRSVNDHESAVQYLRQHLAPATTPTPLNGLGDLMLQWEQTRR
ncbi:MAG: DHH family phosphoesterase [Verrucomicrobium sp.]|nr:DHH family phosphoesterase [Verrucomicrobium sp.]